jgi:hypothetical protein
MEMLTEISGVFTRLSEAVPEIFRRRFRIERRVKFPDYPTLFPDAFDLDEQIDEAGNVIPMPKTVKDYYEYRRKRDEAAADCRAAAIEADKAGDRDGAARLREEAVNYRTTYLNQLPGLKEVVEETKRVCGVEAIGDTLLKSVICWISVGESQSLEQMWTMTLPAMATRLRDVGDGELRELVESRKADSGEPPAEPPPVGGEKPSLTPDLFELHAPRTLTYKGRTVTVDPSAYALLNHMLKNCRPSHTRTNSVSESTILDKVYDNSPTTLTSHCHKANNGLREVEYPFALSRCVVRGKDT